MFEKNKWSLLKVDIFSTEDKMIEKLELLNPKVQ